MIVYLDASAAVKLVMREPETDALLAFLDGATNESVRPCSCVLVETEVRRTATRNGVDQKAVTAMLDVLDLTGLARDMFTDAGLLQGHSLRTLDALHVVAALRAGADTFVTYDARQADAAQEAGLRIASPA